MSGIVHKRIQEKNQKTATLLGFMLIPLSGFAIDIYLPSLPVMSGALHVSGIQVQLTITIFLVSYGISQLFVGSMLDSFGRYPIGFWSLILFGIASIVIAQTRNIYLIYAMRVIHGVTIAGIVVAKRAFFVDLYTGDKLKGYLSLFTIIWSTGPILAPFIGGYLETAFGWQSNFYFLAGYAFLIALLEWIFSGETLRFPSTFNLKNIAGIYANMIGTASFSLGLLMLGLAYSMVMVYNMTGPFIIEHHWSFSPITAGYCSLILGLAWMAGGFIGKATVRKPFLRKLMLNLLIQICFVIAMLISTGFTMNIYTLIFFAFIIHVTAGYTYNNYFAYSLTVFPKNAGIAGGLSGGVSYITVSILSYLIVYFIPAKDEINLSHSYLILILLSAFVMFLIYMANRRKANLVNDPPSSLQSPISTSTPAH